MTDDVSTPPQCLMDRNRLARIDTNVENLVTSFNDFRVEVSGRVSALESETKENKEDIKEAKGLAWQIPSAITGGIATIWGLLQIIAGRNG
jgi:hypothetical protein